MEIIMQILLLFLGIIIGNFIMTLILSLYFAWIDASNDEFIEKVIVLWFPFMLFKFNNKTEPDPDTVANNELTDEIRRLK